MMLRFNNHYHILIENMLMTNQIINKEIKWKTEIPEAT